jgi:hypothetical protein
MLDWVGSAPRHQRSDDLAAARLDVINEAEHRSLVGWLAAETARVGVRPMPRDMARALRSILRRTAGRTLPTLTLAVGDDPQAVASLFFAHRARALGLKPRSRGPKIAISRSLAGSSGSHSPDGVRPRGLDATVDKPSDRRLHDV